MITRKSNDASLLLVEISTNNGYLDLKSSHPESLVKAVEMSEGTGWTSIDYASVHGADVVLRMSKDANSSVDLSALRVALRRGDEQAIMCSNARNQDPFLNIEQDVQDVQNEENEEVVAEAPVKAKKKKAVDNKVITE